MQINKPVNWYIDNKLTHSLHTSEARSFRGCRRRWDWVFRQYYYPLVTPKPLEFGVAFHNAMETFYDPDTWGIDPQTSYELAKVAFVRKCDEQFASFKKLNGGADPEHYDDYTERKKLGLGMLRHYCLEESPRYDRGLRPVKVEISFEVPILGPGKETLWCKCASCWRRYKAWDQGLFPEPTTGVGEYWLWRKKEWQGLPVTYGGRIDALLEDEHGRIWIFDWKTAMRLSTGEAGADDSYLWTDDQITRYCWAMWLLGFPVAGFVYAEIKKGYPEEPEPLTRPFKGRLYSTNKQHNYGYEVYYRTVAENDPSGLAAGNYDEFLEYLKEEGGRYHLRHQIHRNEAELRNVGLHIWQEAQEITSPTLAIYPSPGRFSCGGCAYREPCISKNRDEDFQYTLDTMYERRRYHYYEDAEPSTDKPGRG